MLVDWGKSKSEMMLLVAIEQCTDEADTAYIRAISTLHFDAFSPH